ncbi:MAG: transketolase [Clostridia bacterium]|nr:transketolase [Clostridia bacterium]
MDNSTKKELEIFATKVRMGVIEGTYCAKAGHPGGSLSIADVLAYLYNGEMNIDPENSDSADRDRLVLSKGHAAPALYAALALKGYFSTDELKTLRHKGALLQGHPDMKHIPGVDMSTGSLGQGISAACGMAISGKMAGKDYRVYTILGDGEIQEGQVWEAAMFAGFKKLDNLVAFVDFNNLQIDGKMTDVMSDLPIDEKFKAFNWNVINIDGNNLEEIENAYKQAREFKGKPTCIIGKTIKGKGVSFMEDVCSWHGVAPNEEQYNDAMKELKATLEGLEG